MSSPSYPVLPPALSRGLIILSVLILASCNRGGGAQAPAGGMPPPPAVNVAAVVQKDVTQWDEFTGRIEAVDKVEIRARVTGYLDKVAFVDGRDVKKGDLLFQIDDREYRAAYQRANADIERAKARISLAQKQLDRNRSLLNGNAVSKNEVDQRLSELDQARADVSGMQAAAEQARLNLEFTRVVAPISGRVSKALVTPGNLVSSGAPTPTLLTTIVSMDPVYVDFEGDENTYLRYQGLSRSGERQSSRDAQNPVKVGFANEDGYPHDGHMVFVDNALDPASGTIRARAVMENPDGLITPGLFARVRLLGSGAHAAVLIHDRAVMTDQDRKYVFVLGPENKALRRDVKLGPMIEGLRSINDGLKAGDVVLVNGLQKVFFPGMPVAPTTVPMDDPERQPPPPPGGPQGPQGAAH